MANKTPLFARKQSGGVFTVVDETKATGDIWFVNSVTGTDAAGYGQNPDAPVASIDYAIGLATASNGDRIIVMPGHVESVIAAAGLDLDKAGITIVFEGEGNARGRISFGTDVDADMDVDAADITMINPRFVAAIDALTGPIDVNAARFKIIDGTWEDGTTINTTDCIVADANADDMVIDGWTFIDGDAGGTQKESHIQIAAATRPTLKRIRITGDFDTGNIENGTAWVDALLEDVVVDNAAPGPVVGILLQATSTGSARNVHVRVVSGTTYVTADNDMQWFECYGVGTDGQAGDEIGAVASASIEGKVDSVGTQATSVGTQATSVGTQATSVGTQVTSVGTLTTSVGTQATSVGTQAGSVGTLTTSVGTLVSTDVASVGTQATSVGTLTTSVGTQATSIGTQVGSVGTLTTSVGTQATSIGTQVTSVGTLTTSVGTQATSIGTQADSVGTLVSTDVASVGTQATSVGTLTTSVGTQSTSIGTQVGSVGTLTTSVGTQATSIGTQAGSVGTQVTSVGTLTTSVGTQTDSVGTLVSAQIDGAKVLKTTIADGTTIPNNSQTAAGLLATATGGDILIEEIIWQRGATSFTTATNYEFTTNNVNGLTGAAGPNVVAISAKFAANVTSIASLDGTTKQIPFALESTKALYIHGDDNTTGAGGTTDFYIKYRPLTAGASLA